MKILIKFAVILFSVFCLAFPATAQTPPGQGPGNAIGQGNAPGRGMMGDPAQMQKMMEQRLKETLELNDEEWSVIGPKVMKVFELSMSSRGNPGRMMMGRPGMQPPNSNRRRGGMPGMQESPVDTAMQELQTLLEKKDASVDDIKAKVIKIRKAKEKVQQENTSAQKELRELLTVKQEATLIAMGMLD